MNRLLYAVLICTGLLFAKNVAANNYRLNEAASNHLISYALDGSSNSTHYQKPVVLNITNNTNGIIKIEIPAGSLLLANDSSLQNLITVTNELMAIGPYMKKCLPLSAMCVQQHDAAPSDGKKYIPVEMASGPLLALAQLIAEKKYNDFAAQQALWCLTDNAPIADISGWNAAEVSDLQKFVSKVTGKPMPPPPAIDDAKHNYNDTTYEIKIEGSFTYVVRKEAEVLIAMFDKDNRVVRELYRNNKEQPGRKDFAFAFDGSAYTDKQYYIRLLLDGEKRIEGTVTND